MIEVILAIIAAFWFGCATGAHVSGRWLAKRDRREMERIWREYSEADRDG